MARIFYVHWHEAEAKDTVRQLRAAGHKVNFHWNTGQEAWRLIEDTPPDALAISLARLPSHGRAVAKVIDESKRLRELPIIFVGGAPEKVAVTRSKFPNAVFCGDRKLEHVLKRVRPFVPPDATTLRRAAKATAKTSSAKNTGPAVAAGYSGTPLPQKLGIKANHRVALLNAPKDFCNTLGEVPPGVRFDQESSDGQTHDVIILFTKSRADLVKNFSPAACRIEPAGGLWVSWPKKASGVATDVTEDIVRAVGLDAGLVNVKVCAVDQTWSGLKFVIRKKDRPANPKR